MAETVEAEVEAPEEDIDDEEAALLHFAKYSEARRALPWEQWTFREKTSYYLDRIFIGFLIVCLLVFVGEGVYKVWYVTNVKKIEEFMSSVAAFLFNWLFTQEKHEELAEL